ncbi:MAG: hypothetical protein ABIV50_08650 [Opitutus sp.]
MMKRLVIVLLVLAVAADASATLIPLSITRSVGIGGTAGEINYSESVSSTLDGTFSSSLTNSASWTDTEPKIAGFSASSYRAASSAAQNSTVSGSDISVDIDLFASSGVSLWGPYSSGYSSTSSAFECIFLVQQALYYEFTMQRFVSGHDLPGPFLNFQLVGDNAGSILNPNSGLFGSPATGILLPDTYTLRFNASAMSVVDPLGDFKSVDWSMHLNTSPVPDGASTFGLLGLALAGTSILGRFMRRPLAAGV